MDTLPDTTADAPSGAIEALLEQVAALPLSAFVRQSDWAYPALEIVHVLGLALVFAPILLFDLRVLGFNAGFELTRLRRLLLPWVWFGFGLNAVSGVLMFLSDAVELWHNPAFRVKLLLIAAAGVNAALFQTQWLPLTDNDREPGRLAKASAVASICLWLAVIAAGRLMAYIKG